VDLNSLIDPTLGWELTDADAINDQGVIVGQGYLGNQQAFFVLTPVAAVPEPSIFSLLGVGLLPLLAAWKARSKQA
jgi:hypothetical protein